MSCFPSDAECGGGCEACHELNGAVTSGTCETLMDGDAGVGCGEFLGDMTCMGTMYRDHDGACTDKLDNGDPCVLAAGGDDCTNGFCVDEGDGAGMGVCCNTVYDETCKTCATGTCNNYGFSDPEDECAGNDSARRGPRTGQRRRSRTRCLR